MSELQGARLLVVDDEIDLRAAIRFELEMAGAIVTEAGSGFEALDIVKNERFELILSDIRMPNGNGIELLDGLRAMQIPTPIVMFITGHADFTPELAYAKGCSGFISKPFDPEYLVKLIARALMPSAKAWAVKCDRLPTDLEIKIKYGTLDDALQARIFNISTGGMFVKSAGPFPDVGDVVRFELQGDEDLFSPIAGEGLVRWVRRETQHGYAPGYGVEFYGLTEGSIASLTRALEKIKSRLAYIPSA